MKLTKDHLIEGEIIKEGTEIKIKESNMLYLAGMETDTWFIVPFDRYESTYFYQEDPNNIYSIQTNLGKAQGKAKKEGKNAIKKANPTPVIISEEDVPESVKKKIKARMM